LDFLFGSTGAPFGPIFSVTVDVVEPLPLSTAVPENV
jgi:hypothetical protein